jgi:hypothetical protein
VKRPLRKAAPPVHQLPLTLTTHLRRYATPFAAAPLLPPSEIKEADGFADFLAMGSQFALPYPLPLAEQPDKPQQLPLQLRAQQPLLKGLDHLDPPPQGLTLPCHSKQENCKTLSKLQQSDKPGDPLEPSHHLPPLRHK